MTEHKHYPKLEHKFYDERRQWDEDCRQLGCPGIARVDMAYAPDTGMNWLRCCCCGDYWNPGAVRYLPYEERLND